MHALWVVLHSAWLAHAAGDVAMRQGASDEALSVTALRFYQPSGGATSFEVLSELRLRAVAAAGAATARYRVEVWVQDSAGNALASNQWDREVPSELARAPGATMAESFRFAAAPGRYTILVRAVPAGGTVVQRELVVRAFEARPPVSDLLLATAVRQVASDSNDVGPGEIRRAGLAMRSAPVPQLSLESATLAYYAEVYPWQGAAVDGELRVEVAGRDGRRVVGTAPRPVRLEAAGGMVRGSLDLTGLPEGGYTFRMLVRLGDSTVISEAPFAVAHRGPGAEMASAPAAAADLFEGMAEPGLDSLYGPLTYLLEENERGVYGALSAEGKRRFLRQFWQRRDPTPQTPENTALADFYRVVAYVNEAFRESGRGQVIGWQTDRGRVYFRNGRPDEVLRRPLASPRPYEVWKYTRGRMRYYVFWDQSGFGTYILIGTNDRRESSQQEWERYLGPEGSQDVAQFIR